MCCLYDFVQLGDETVDEKNAFIKQSNHIFGETNMLYHEAAVRLGLSDSVMAVLYTLLVQGESCTIGEIIHQSGMSKQTLNSALRRMEADGLICLKAEGAKRKRVALTPEGSAFAGRTVQRLIDIENRIFSAWTQAERDCYIELSRRYSKAFGESIEELR